ncbi:hypothetical protein Tco_1345433 [Tanacetum coccineum]
MRTRSQSRNFNRQQQQVPPTFVEPFDLEEPIDNPAPPVVTMADNRTMAQLFKAPTEGYEDAIVVPEITADNFEHKHAPAYQAPAPQTQGASKEDFQNYIKANDMFINTNTASTSGSGSLPSNTVANPKSNLKAITTRSGVSYNGTQVPPSPSSLPKVVERETEVTKDTVPPTNNGSTKDVQPPVFQVQPQVPNSEPVVAPVSAPMPNPKPLIRLDLLTKRSVKKLTIKLRNFTKSFKICISTLASRML